MCVCVCVCVCVRTRVRTCVSEMRATWRRATWRRASGGAWQPPEDIPPDLHSDIPLARFLAMTPPTTPTTPDDPPSTELDSDSYDSDDMDTPIFQPLGSGGKKRHTSSARTHACTHARQHTSVGHQCAAHELWRTKASLQLFVVRSFT